MIERYVTSRGYQVIREYGGHGIGQKMHEEPFIPNFRGGKNIVIKEGSFICIEPLVQIGDNIIEVSAVDN
jgi:methionyl aminopeptidase